jgi:hypothetical protein
MGLWRRGVEASDLADALGDVAPGDLDLVVVAWRSATSGCVIPGPYLGFGLPPSPGSREAGFVTLKLEVDGPLDPIFTAFEENDPGVFLHEWLHTVAEDFYPSLGAEMPAGTDGSIVHAAEGNFRFTLLLRVGSR